jgi:hypothetical protein
MIMTRLSKTAAFVLLVTLIYTANASAWDITYDGSVLPSNLLLGPSVWQQDSNNFLGASSAVTGVLHLVDSNSVMTARFYREGSMNAPSGRNVTMETRVKVVSSTSPYGSDYSGVGFGVSTAGTGGQYVRMWTDRLGIMYPGSNYPTFYYLDMTQFHTIRLNVNGSDRTFGVWVDGTSVFSGSAPGGNNWGGIQFGTDYVVGATSESYWDYLAYTVPEPSSILALLAGLGGLGAMFRKRRRTSS